MVPKRSAALAVCLAVALALSGCAGQQLTDDQEQRVVEEFEENLAEIDGYHATVTSTTTFDNQTYRTTAEVWARTGTGEIRQRVLAPESRAGNLLVSNGSVLWSYDVTENTATRIDVPDTGNGTALVPRVDELVERYDIYANGTVTLDGTETRKLTLVPNESTASSVAGEMTMWVDTERLFPLKLSMEFGGTTSTIRYENLTLNPDYPADAFAFDPPANATVREPQTPNVSEFESHAALADATDRPLPEASLPRGFTFERGSVVDGNSTVVSLTYTDGDRQLSVVVTDTRARESDGETVTVGDRTGTYREFGDRGSLAWTCGDTRYAVLGPVERETLVDVGAAIDC